MSISMDELKQVILVNGWVDMPVGKLLAQVSHASMAFLTNRMVAENSGQFVESRIVLPSDIYTNWVKGSFAKLVLVVRSEEEWQQVLCRVEKAGLEKGKDFYEIIDKGRTVFNGIHTHTCTGFIPMPQSTINKLFGSLPLLK